MKYTESSLIVRVRERAGKEGKGREGKGNVLRWTERGFFFKAPPSLLLQSYTIWAEEFKEF